MRRREFIGGLGGAAAWPVAARAQQASRVARIGFLGTGSSPDTRVLIDAFQQGLRAWRRGGECAKRGVLGRCL